MRFNKVFSNLLALLFCTHLFAQTDSLNTDTKVPAHPRLLLLKGEESALKKNISSDKVWSDLHKAILQECDGLLTVKPLERIQIGRRLLSVSREAIRRIFFLSYAYRLTSDKKYLQRAEKELVTIAAFRDWNPPHFLDVAEMTTAASIGYDWLFNDLSKETKAAVKEAILTKGLEPSLDEEKNKNWLLAEHNWNQVCNTGMTYGALATFEDHEELSRRIVNRALRSITIPMNEYNPDGAYPEGYGYWGYGTSFNVMFLSALEKAFGTDFGLSTRSQGFLKTGGFLENMTGPSGRPFNYSDAGQNGELQPAMFWFASRVKDPSLLWVERRRLMEDPKSHVKNRLLPAIMLWGGNININNAVPPAKTMWVGRGKNPVALMRTSWTDSNAVWVAMKGGTVSANHAHMDVGSFVMEADGVRWAMDFGMQDYESLESKGIQLFGRTQDAQRWTVFRLTNLVHNTLTANGQHQRVTGSAPLIRTSSDPLFMQATTDMSEVYKGTLAKAVRGIAIVDKKYVLIRDEVQARDTATVLRWTMLTPADVKITGSNTLELTKNGKRLLLQVTEPANVTMKTWSTAPPHDYDAPNPGTTLVGFEVSLPPNAKTALSVKLIPASANNSGQQATQSLSNWKGEAVPAYNGKATK
ncbi:heparinase II/III domain-containing protein [Flavisolibacter ginsenosidimutans]|uniref:DUF4962 domain-containing protein n=1 Tax=Flavisolibacter ginsenosidimutans TaxID=661481 RepID=A0A5B8UPT3_9BACT|nr:heparinase II/III family protein [Flavisolibacter ginsenosidimutans]QEC57955.1 DUF4962 domain-containing protein [Flavisolibacter ginsenosidimutans]